MYNITIINSNEPVKYYMCEGSEGVSFTNISQEELNILLEIVNRHNYTIVINKMEE